MRLSRAGGRGAAAATARLEAWRAGGFEGWSSMGGPLPLSGSPLFWRSPLVEIGVRLEARRSRLKAPGLKKPTSENEELICALRAEWVVCGARSADMGEKLSNNALCFAPTAPPEQMGVVY